MLDGEVIGVREDVSLESAMPKFRVQRNHRWNLGEDVRKIAAEFLHAALKSDGIADLFKEFPPVDCAAFVLDEQRRGAQESCEIAKRFGAARGHLAGGNRIIEVHQHLAEIEDNDRVHNISLRPSSARLKVSSSANSSPLPAGNP